MDRVQIHTRRASSSTKKSARRLELLGKPLLLEGERLEDFNALRDAVAKAIKATDIFDEILINDVVQLQWWILRLRRQKDALLKALAPGALRAVFESFEHDLSHSVIQAWAERDPDALKAIEELLASWDLTSDVIYAELLNSNLDAFERIDRMIAGAEVRRNIAMREIERRRFLFQQSQAQLTRLVAKRGSSKTGES